MIIALFGGSCTGKSTIADELNNIVDGRIYTGKDYLKLARNEAEAKKAFIGMLKANEETSEVIIYVISEKEQLALLPDKAFRILITAELDMIKERFKKRMNGSLPAPVEAMLEKKHGMFDFEKRDLHVNNAGMDEALSDICNRIILVCGLKYKLPC